MADKLIPNDDTQNYNIHRIQLNVKSLHTELKEQTNQNLIKVPKVVEPSSYYKTLGTDVINSPMSPPSLVLNGKQSLQS